MNKSKKVKVLEYNAIFLQEQEGGYSVSIPDLPGCYSQGETVDEAVLEITAVAQSLIELYKEEELKVPLKLQKEKKVNNPLSVPIIVAA